MEGQITRGGDFLRKAFRRKGGGWGEKKKKKSRYSDSETAHGCFQFDFIEVFWKLDPDLPKSYKETSSGI